jgi:hypothetical protein
MNDARKELGLTKNVSVLVEDLPFVDLQAPLLQPVHFAEVAANPESHWRAGLNVVPANLLEKINDLVKEELTLYSNLAGYLAKCFLQKCNRTPVSRKCKHVKCRSTCIATTRHPRHLLHK